MVRRNDIEEDEDDGKGKGGEDTVITFLEGAISILSTPLLQDTLEAPIMVVYPLVILISFFLVPKSTFLLFSFGFGTFSFFGRSVVSSTEDEEEREEFEDGVVTSSTDLLALGASAATAALLTPIETSSQFGKVVELGSGSGLALLTTVICVSLALFLAGIILQQSSDNIPTGKNAIKGDDNEKENDKIISNEQQIMNLWDKSLQRSARNDAGKDEKEQNLL